MLPRRILVALLAVLAWLGFVVEGSHALFTDQATLAGNSITTGTTNLLISNSQNASSTVYDKSRPGFALNLSPGEQSEKYFLLKNSSSGDVDFRLSIGATNLGSMPIAMGPFLSLILMQVDDSGTAIGSPFVTLLSDTLSSSRETPFILPKGSTQRFKLISKLSDTYSTQGDAVSYDLVMTGKQVITQ